MKNWLIFTLVDAFTVVIRSPQAAGVNCCTLRQTKKELEKLIYVLKGEFNRYTTMMKLLLYFKNLFFFFSIPKKVHFWNCATIFSEMFFFLISLKNIININTLAKKMAQYIEKVLLLNKIIQRYKCLLIHKLFAPQNSSIYPRGNCAALFFKNFIFCMYTHICLFYLQFLSFFRSVKGYKLNFCFFIYFFLVCLRVEQFIPVIWGVQVTPVNATGHKNDH